MSGYIGVEPVTQVTKVRTFGTLVEASTTIPVAGGFSPGNIEVYINGDYVLPTDYNESDGLTIVFGITLTAGTDYVVIEARQFLVADTWSKAEADTRYAEITGGANSNFTAMPQVGGDPIVESGSNADGEWTRWADGTQICSVSSTPSTLTTSTAVGALARGSVTWDFPIAFISTPTGCSSSLSANSNEFAVTSGGSTTEAIVTGWSVNGSSRTRSPSAVAIGRWK